MKNTKILALLLIVVLAFSLTLGVVAAPTDPTIAVELKSSTATQVTVNLVIKNNPGFDLCRTFVYFDNTKLSYNGTTGYSMNGSIVPASKAWTPGYVAGENKITCSIVTMAELFGMAPYVRVSGNGLLVTLTFDVIGDATGDAYIYATTAANDFVRFENGKEVKIEPAEMANVVVSVKDGKVVGATEPTNPPTQPSQPTNPPTEPIVPPTEPIVPPTEPECEHEEYTTTIKQPTCAVPGLAKVFCVKCNAFIRDEEIPATGDHVSERIDGVAADCTNPGLTVGSKCSECGVILIEQKEIPALKHNEVELKGKAPTCAEAGLTYGLKCDRCGEILTAQEEIPATGKHVPTVVPGKAPTCDEPGLTDGERCSECGKILEAQKEIPALGEHEYEVTRVEPDCVTNGSETKKCKICGDKQTTVLEALGHSPAVIEGKDSTCTETGLTDGSYCSVCTETLEEQKVIPVIPHVYGEWVVSKEATCKVLGLKVRTCVCGASESVDLPLVDHTPVADEAVASTCTKAGLTAGEHCSVCNEVLVAQKEVAKLEHDFKKVSENEDGTSYECSACGEKSFVPHEENPPTTDNVVSAIVALVLMCASAVVIFNGKKWTIG